MTAGLAVTDRFSTHRTLLQAAIVVVSSESLCLVEHLRTIHLIAVQ
ncbi:MAG: hypothetical protein HY231_06360 [Acidobacteria bacterium]|nr:hypothetical protein [Acidobacteriota bacterium]